MVRRAHEEENFLQQSQCGKNRALEEKWPKLGKQEVRMWFEPGRSKHMGMLQIVQAGWRELPF